MTRVRAPSLSRGATMRALFLGGLVLSTSRPRLQRHRQHEQVHGRGRRARQESQRHDVWIPVPSRLRQGTASLAFTSTRRRPRSLSVTGASATQGLGGHHMIIYWLDTPRDPQHHTCTDAEMVSWHQIAGAAGDSGAEGLLTLPEGAALKGARRETARHPGALHQHEPARRRASTTPLRSTPHSRARSRSTSTTSRS